MPASTLTICPPPPAPAARAMAEPLPLPTEWERGVGARDRALARARTFGATGFALSRGLFEYGALTVPPRGVPADAHLFEVIPASLTCHVYLDVEWKPTELLPRVLDPVEVLRLTRMGTEQIHGTGPLTAQIMCASGLEKESYHIKFDNTCVTQASMVVFVAILKEWVAGRCVPSLVIDASVYSDNHLMRMLGQSKVNEPARVFVPYGDSSPNVEDHLIGIYTPDARELTWRVPAVEPVAVARTAVARTAVEDSPELRGLIAKCVGMLDIKRADNYDTWKDVCWALFNTGYTLGEPDAFKALWVRFSARSAKYNAVATEEKWNKARPCPEDGKTLRSLRTWAREDNPIGYGPVSRAFGRMWHAAREAANLP